MTAMQFDELVPGAAVRFTVVDGAQYLSVRDFIMVVCSQNNKRASATWINLSEDKKNEVSQFLRNWKFSGPREKEQPVITFDGALTLMNWLPGENAKKWRGKTTQILKRYFAGDPTLLDDIQANAESSAPINQAARAAMDNPQQPSIDDEEKVYQFKRRRIETDRMEIENLKKSNPLFQKRMDLQVVCCNNLERWHAIENKIENDRLDRLEKQNFIELEKQKQLKEMELALEKQKIDLDFEKQQKQMALDAKKNQEFLEAERAKLELAKETHRHELEVRKALKALDQVDPDTTTILKVYEATKDAYSLLRADQRKPFLVKAGVYAARDYVLQNGVHPNKVSERGQDVNAYPLSAECILRDALKTSYAEITAGKAQPRIDAAIWRRVPAPV